MMQMNDVVKTLRPFVIGITGGIGSGKSYVSCLLQEHFQVPIYDSDKEAKQLTATHPDIKTALQKLVGQHVYGTDDSLQKEVLALFLFSDDRNAAQVNSIIHPFVKQHFIQWVQRQEAAVVAIESAILFESGFNSLVDGVLYVDAPTDVRLERSMKRDGATAQKIQARMDRQQVQFHREKADWVLLNNASTDEQLLQQLRHIVAEATKQ